ncbi:MAG TPA: GNAT family N-acetyltransferase [Allosphingosinicella sp.]|nr:GNAT family N-acetyltransferase [Allosphingosinicella sp.]
MAIPAVRIETERLILRVLTVDDFDDYLAMTADPETFRFSERGPMGSDEAWTRLLRQVGHWALLGFGPFAVEEKASGRFVGEAGLGDFRRNLGPEFDGAPEAAWALAGWARERGYATEAAAAALAWMEERFSTQRTVCLIHSDNELSLRVARKLGFSAFQERVYRGYPALLHERQRPIPIASTTI